jgi:hypothetical protein
MRSGAGRVFLRPAESKDLRYAAPAQGPDARALRLTN